MRDDDAQAEMHVDSQSHTQLKDEHDNVNSKINNNKVENKQKFKYYM